jgi:hypothetical protein
MNPNNPFLLRPENGRFIDGETQQLSGRLPVGCAWVPVVIALLAIFVMLLAAFQGKRVTSFKRHRAVVQGRLIGRRVSASPGMVDVETGMVHGGEDDYLLTYRFDIPAAVGQKSFEREASVSKGAYDSVRLGDKVRVIYDAANPAFSVLQCEGDPTEPFILVVFGYGLLGVAILAFVLLAVLWWKFRCLALHGRQLQGRVVSCTGTKHEDGGLIVRLEYKFSSPSGREIADSAVAFRANLTESTLPAPDSAVAVIYYSDSIYQLL